jgi:hypothetical protein
VPAWCERDGGRAAHLVEGSLRPALFLPRTIPPVDPSNLTRVNMSEIKVAIDALKTVSTLCGMVPLVGENLKSAVELASAICEKVQVRPSTFSHLSLAVLMVSDHVHRP